MSIGTAAAIGIGVSAAGGLASSIIGSKAAKSAAQTQEQSAQAAIDEQKRQFDITTANQQPWLQAGQGALTQLTAGTQPGGAFTQKFGETYTQPAAFDGGPAFTAPTLDNTNDPGYAFRLQQGEQALQRGAAAGGGAFSGGTLKALQRYGQDYASGEYGNVYNRALQGYQTNFADKLNAYNTNVNTGLTGYQTRYNTYNNDQTNQFNRLAALSGVGQSAANTLASTGAANANNISELLTQQGNAGAAGTLGGASAINTGIQGVLGGVQSGIGNYQTGQLINALTGGSGGGGTYAPPAPIPYYSPPPPIPYHN